MGYSCDAIKKKILPRVHERATFVRKKCRVVICRMFAIFSQRIVGLDCVYKDDTNCTANQPTGTVYTQYREYYFYESHK